MRKALSVLVLGATLLVLTSCGNQPRAFLRIVHAAPGMTTTPSLDISIDGNKVLSSVAYATGSNYFTVTPGARHLQINVTGDSKNFLIDTTTSNLASKTYTTLTLDGIVDSTPKTISLLTTTDDHGPPAAGQVKIRVLNAAVGFVTTPPPQPTPPAPPAPVDVYITTFGTLLNGNPPTPTLPGVSFQTTTAYVSKAVGDLQIRVVGPAGCGDPILFPACNPDLNIIADSGKITFTDKKQLRTYVVSDQAPPSAQFQGFLLTDLN